MKVTQPNNPLTSLQYKPALTFAEKRCSRLPETLLLFAGQTGGKKNEREQKMARGEHLLLSRAAVPVISEQETRSL